MRWSPVRFELKTIRVPSGDHDGYSPPSVWGSVRRPVPSGRITVMIPLDPLGPAKAISEPSGDQAGDKPSVSRRCSVPSTFMIQISGSPLRSRRNAMRVPSGDHDGSKSSPGLVVSLLRPVPSASTTYTSMAPWAPAEKVIRSDSDLDPPPLLGPNASDADAAGDGRSSDRRPRGPPLHAPTTRTTAREVVSMRPQFMPLLHPGCPDGSAILSVSATTLGERSRLMDERSYSSFRRRKERTAYLFS